VRSGGADQTDQTPAKSSPRLPKEVQDALSPAVERAWKQVAPYLPAQVYLGGGTAIAIYLHHRVSRDLDFFYHEDSLDLDALERELKSIGAAVTLRAPGTLRVQIGEAKVEFLHADEKAPQHQIEKPKEIGGVPLASLRDIMAMKLKVLAERGELRDYYDVMQIDERGGVSVEDGIALFLERYGLDAASEPLHHLIRSLGYLDDCEDDEEVPISKHELAAWWRKRQAEVIRNL
jgi:predicted nucleotidyltransferase component of viral defense system